MTDERVADITVVVPVLNKMPDLLRCVASLARQTIRPAQVIFVDDGSTDGGVEYLRQLDWPNVVVLTRPSPGPGGYAARNCAIRHAVTEWISFLDADDEWDAEYLRNVHDLAQNGPSRVGCIFTGYARRRKDDTLVVQKYMQRRGAQGVHELDLKAFLDAWLADRECPIWTGAASFRRTVLLESGLFPEHRCKRGGDKDLWLRAMNLGTALHCNKALATYRTDSTNMVTVSVATTEPHCITQTIETLLETAPPELGSRLRKLHNLEAFLYVLHAARAGRFGGAPLGTFYVRDNPILYALSRAISSRMTAPLWPILEWLKRRSSRRHKISAS